VVAHPQVPASGAFPCTTLPSAFVLKIDAEKNKRLPEAF